MKEIKYYCQFHKSTGNHYSSQCSRSSFSVILKFQLSENISSRSQTFLTAMPYCTTESPPLVAGGCVTYRFAKIQGGSLIKLPQNGDFRCFQGIFGEKFSSAPQKFKKSPIFIVQKWVTYRFRSPPFGRSSPQIEP